MAQAQDEGFHEIQLNGKQLVFLFMATTVVSVVIFLLGVLVGRGVRAERTAADAAAAATVAETPQAAPPSTPLTPAADPTAAEAPAPVSEKPAAEKAGTDKGADKLTYFDSLQKKNGSGEPLKSTSGTSVAPRPAEKVEKKVEKAEPMPPPAAAAAPAAPAPQETRAEPGGNGYAVQIAALNVRSEADAIAKRLTSKGYQAYVLAPPSGSPPVFRVRVGKFPTRREAESIAAKLQKEEQFKPWVTR